MPLPRLNGFAWLIRSDTKKPKSRHSSHPRPVAYQADLQTHISQSQACRIVIASIYLRQSRVFMFAAFSYSVAFSPPTHSLTLGCLHCHVLSKYLGTICGSWLEPCLFSSFFCCLTGHDCPRITADSRHGPYQRSRPCGFDISSV